MPSISTTIVASLACLVSLSSAAVLPRATSGYFWVLSTTAQDTSYSSSIITACNGKFYIGNNACQKTVVVSCGSTTGASTTCALVASQGPQAIYIASDGSLAYTAPNAAVPTGINAHEWSTAAQVGYSRSAANSASTFFSSDLVICDVTQGGQIFSLQGFQGCSGERQHVASLAVPNTLEGGAYTSY
ncbi:hypothetical protein MMC13_002322 [Lambiella insularis]|nr:hypothetical protein [Lambiella insularis]